MSLRVFFCSKCASTTTCVTKTDFDVVVTPRRIWLIIRAVGAIDWAAARLDYVTHHEMTYAEIAAKYHAAHSTVYTLPTQ